VRIAKIAGLTSRKSAAEFCMRIVRMVILGNQIEDELVGDRAHVLSPTSHNPQHIFVNILAKLGRKTAHIYLSKCSPGAFPFMRLGGLFATILRSSVERTRLLQFVYLS